MLVGSELGPLDLGEVGIVGALGDPDVAAAGADGDLLAGEQRDRRHFGHLARGRGDLDAFVEIVLAGFGDADGVDGGELAGLGSLGGFGRSGRCGGHADGESGEGENEGELLHKVGFQ